VTNFVVGTWCNGGTGVPRDVQRKGGLRVDVQPHIEYQLGGYGSDRRTATDDYNDNRERERVLGPGKTERVSRVETFFIVVCTGVPACLEGEEPCDCFLLKK
jgi:hypothetical protein